MAACPFCRSAVSEEISRFGGHCPQCLIEIPGEETATDPGEGRTGPVQTSTGSGPLVSGLVAAVVVLASVGVWYSQQLTDGEKGPARSGYKALPLSSHEDQTIPDVLRDRPVAEVAMDDSETREDSSDRRNRTGGQLTGVRQTVAEGRVIPKAGPTQMVNPLDAFAVGSGPPIRGPQGIVLTDEGQIESMIGRVLDRGNKRLDACFQRRLQARPGYKGEWQVSVDIGTTGAVVGVDVSALSGADRTMERCIRSQVGRWTFQRIADPVSSGTVYRFGN